MEQKPVFHYFYGNEADVYSFYRIPKQLFCDYFKGLSCEAKILYGLMLDRMSLSIKNQWFDDDNKAFIYFSIEDTMEMLNCGRNKAVKSMQELDSDQGIGLIEKKRQGMGKPSIIYVKNFAMQECDKKSEDKTAEEESEVSKPNFKKFIKYTSRNPEINTQEVCKRDGNNTNINYTESNKTESNQIVSQNKGDGLDSIKDVAAYAEIIRENISFDTLLENHPFDQELIQGMYELILEMVLCQGKEVVIARNHYPLALVKSKFMKLNSLHLEYVINCLQANTTKVRNIKQYLLAALFNAPTTIGGYYTAEVNHDLPQYSRG